MGAGVHEVRLDWCAAAQLPRRALEQSEAWLHPAEAERLRKFLRTESRRDYLIGRWLARRALLRDTAVAPEDWAFELGPLGRPHPRTQAACATPIPDINISHGGGVVVCASVLDANVGVDVESTQRALPNRRLERFLAPGEFEALSAYADDERAECFWRFWTLKEAFLKARGTGIAGSLSSFEVRIRDSADPEVVGISDSHRWRLAGFRLPGQVVGGIAVHALRPALLRVALVEAGSPD